MKKILFLCVILFPSLLWSQIEISSKKPNYYTNEIVYIEALIPGVDELASYTIQTGDLPCKVLSQRTRIIDITEDHIDVKYVKYYFQLLYYDYGEAKISLRIKEEQSRVIFIEIRDSLVTSETGFPFLKTEISNENIYIGEAGYLSNTFISSIYTNDTPYVCPETELELTTLKPRSTGAIFVGDVLFPYKTVSAYSYSSDIAGVFHIPESSLTYSRKVYPVPGFNITVIPLPSNIPPNALIGNNITVERENLRKNYLYRAEIDFSITIKGNVNLSELESLREYMKIPSYIQESVELKRDYFMKGEMVQILTLRYQGEVDNITGITIPSVNVPLFNTTTKSLEYISREKIRIPGSVSIYLLCTILSVVLIITFGIIVFSLRIVKNRRIQEKPVSDFNEIPLKFDFSKREKEIFIILINGKSTKEIADELFISPETVKKHIQNILKKTETKSRLELLALVNNGI